MLPLYNVMSQGKSPCRYQQELQQHAISYVRNVLFVRRKNTLSSARTSRDKFVPRLQLQCNHVSQKPTSNPPDILFNLNTSVFLESRFASAFCSYEFLRAHTRHKSPRYPINRIDLSPLAIIQGVVTRSYIIL